MTAKYAIGIDLGTTNSEIAYIPLEGDDCQVTMLPVPQLTAPSTVEARGMLPSFTYLAEEEESASGSYDLPWAGGGRNYAVGELARSQAAEVPMRTVAAAKSWLCHSRVDRREPILPWNAPKEVVKISPVEASRRYLEHMVSAWNATFPNDPLIEQQVTLTVPASFDASARDLTREAAMQAGLPEKLVLLEEPQAALYSWLADMGDRWRKQLRVGDIILVCDVGGGTTDFTLIGVGAEKGDLHLSRIAVGNHILVGGDNMDLALAHLSRNAFAEKGVDINPWQSVALWHSCRVAKEAILGEKQPKSYPVAVLGRGSRVIGGTVSIELNSDQVCSTLLDGFFPPCKLGSQPASKRISGFKELGLPFETDVAITHHISQFLTMHGDKKNLAVQPTHLLFNGGVFKSKILRERLVKVFTEWFGTDKAPKFLDGRHDLDFAVARGAAFYGRVKRSGAFRIRGGIARAYYVGIETVGPAVPGALRPIHALCVAPKGMEEGTAISVPSEEIGLVVGEQAYFRFFSSATRKHDKPGDLIASWSQGEIIETDAMEAKLPARKGSEEGYVPVKFETHLTELGVLELWCVSTISNDRWKLEFSVRQEE